MCLAEMDRLRELSDAELELVDIHSVTDTVGLPGRETLLGALALQAAIWQKPHWFARTTNRNHH